MRIFIALDMSGNIIVTDDVQNLPEKMMRVTHMDIPERGWKREVNIILGGKKVK